MRDSSFSIPLDPKLKKDSHLLGLFDDSALLLMRNALFPWFVLVPNSLEIEFYKLNKEMQVKILRQINLMSKFVDENYSVDKLNIASIGNIVSQLHIHIVGRNRNDACWPNVVWGVKKTKPYALDEVVLIREKLVASFPGQFCAENSHN